MVIVINPVSLNPRSIVRVLALMACVIVLASLIVEFMVYLPEHRTIPTGLVQLFYLDEEQNIPTFFCTFLLLCATFLISVITMLKKRESDPLVSYWAILALGFFVMATDEGAALHEHLIMPVRGLMGSETFGIFYWAWVVPGIGLVIVLGLYYVRFFLHLSSKAKRAFLASAILYVGGALGIEMIGGRYAELHGRFNLTYSAITTVEESLEMAGTILFIWALLVYIADTYKEVQIRIDTPAPF